MSDNTTVFFKFLGDKGLNVYSNLLDITVFGHNIKISFYGAIIGFGFVLAVLFGGRLAYKWKMSIDKMLDVLIYGTLAAIIGARLYYVFSEWDYFSQHLELIPQIWTGGLAIYGGLIGGLTAAFVVCKVRKLNFYNLLDLAGISFLIGQFIGRWGNFTNQEAFGTNTNLPWGMKSAKTAEYLYSKLPELKEQGMTVNPDGYVHPTFLYESLWCFLGFLVLFFILKKHRKFSGEIFLCYGIWYGTGRTVFEGLRTDSLYLFNTNIRVSQLLSIAIVITCTVILILKLIKYKKDPKPIEGIDYFPDSDLKEKKKIKNEKQA